MLLKVLGGIIVGALAGAFLGFLIAGPFGAVAGAALGMTLTPLVTAGIIGIPTLLGVSAGAAIGGILGHLDEKEKKFTSTYGQMHEKHIGTPNQQTAEVSENIIPEPSTTWSSSFKFCANKISSLWSCCFGSTRPSVVPGEEDYDTEDDSPLLKKKNQ